MVSMDLEQTLQGAFNYAANYLQLEPPEVKISRDFDLDRLIGQDITALNALFEQGVLDRDEFRQILVQGEILPTATESTAEEELLETPEEEAAEAETPGSEDQMERLIQALLQ